MRTILIAGILAFGVFAQAPTEPAPLIQLIRRPGIDASSIRRYADARAAVNVLGMVSITGSPETWLVALHDSFGSIEDVDKVVRPLTPGRTPEDPLDQLPNDVFAISRSLIAYYRPGLSYRPDQAIRVFPKARYIHATIYRIRPGTEAGFAEVVKLRRGALETTNVDRPDIAYQVISGASSGTYVFLAPLTSLRSLDEGMAKTPVYAESFLAAAANAGSKAAVESEISRVRLLFRVEPGMSYVSDDFASADVEFWRPNNKAQ
jgi:hypothetical protein